MNVEDVGTYRSCGEDTLDEIVHGPPSCSYPLDELEWCDILLDAHSGKVGACLRGRTNLKTMSVHN